jgi:hypothetical protein
LEPCKIDTEASHQYGILLRRLRKAYPHIEADLQPAFEDIQKDFRGARHATCIPGFDGKLFKYRQNSSDIKRGARYGFRIIAYYHKDSNTLFPLIVYAKPIMEDYDRNELKRIVKDFSEALRSENIGSESSS